MPETLEQYVTFNPFVVQEATPLSELGRMLVEMGFHHWPVVDDDGRLIGVVSDADLLQRMECDALAMVGDSEASTKKQGDWRTTTAGEVMSRRLITVTLQDVPRAALRRFLGQRIHSLPVLTNEKLVGMITTTDFLREFSYGTSKLSHDCVTSFLSNSSDPLDVDITWDEALEVMQVAGVEFAVAIERDKPLGVVSRRQIRTAKCCVAYRESCNIPQNFTPRTLRHLIHETPVLRPGQRMLDAAGLMLEHKVQAISVVNQARRLLGMVTEEDVLRVMLET